jgi:hypothetical protein
VRNLLLLLLLVNLGVLAWFSWIEPEPVTGARYDGPSITLLRELDANATIITASQPATAAVERPLPAGSPFVEPPVERCLAIGPFTDPVDADSAFASLIAAGFAPNQSVVEEEVWDGYWVYISGIPSRDVAQEMLTVLGENGVEDAYFIPNTDSGVLISLGVFSNITRAGAQAERVGRLGYEATIADRTSIAETRWLEVTLTGEDSFVLELLQSPGRISRLEQRSCSAASGD